MLLRQNIRTPIWPYIAVVTCLFLLSILAARSWQSRRVASEPTLPVTAVEPHPSVFEGAQVAMRVEPTPDIEPVPTTRSEAYLAEGNRSVSLNPALPTDVFQVEMPRQVAPIAPPVGEEIKLEISVKETPALPMAPEPMPEPAVRQPAAPADAPMPPFAVEVPPTLERSAPKAVPEVASDIPFAEVVIRAYQALLEQPTCRAWAQQSIAILEQLHQAPSLTAPDTALQLDRLATAYQQGYQLAERTSDLPLRAQILRVSYATQRRSEIWRQVQRIVAAEPEPALAVTPANMAKPLAAVETRLATASRAAEWRQYLLLDEVRAMSSRGTAEGRRELAKRILKRVASPQLTAKQAELFAQPPFDAFCRELRRWSSEPVDYLRLLDEIEQYERSRQHADSSPIAISFDNLRWSTNPHVEKLVEMLNVHYRNSNVRVSLTSEFLNRLLPEPQYMHEEVADNISGATVEGTSRVLNRLKLVLVPDAHNLRIGLEAHGEVESDTAASKGPATLYNRGFGRYYARKLLLIDRLGIRVWRAEAVANNQTELTGVETDFDAVPLLGWMARSMARQQHDERYYEAKAEAEAKMEWRATERFDEEVQRRLSVAEGDVSQKLLQPFQKMDLRPTPVDLRTTEQRLIARYRLASDTQLGANTPRPQAPGDSLMSVQIHESALNNMLANLRLEGKRTDLHSLYREIAATFERPELTIPDDIPENVTVEFADQDAVRVRCEDNRVALTIRIAELKSGRNLRWTNFSVKAYYVPDAAQLNANLVRDGVIELSGERLGDRLPLRGIFNRVLSRSRSVNMINKKIAESGRLNDSHVNQFVINDGWIGVAIGPYRAGELEHLAAERKKPPKR